MLGLGLRARARVLFYGLGAPLLVHRGPALPGQQSLQSGTRPRPSGFVILVRGPGGVCSIRAQDHSGECAHIGPHRLSRLLKYPAHLGRLDVGHSAPLALGGGPDYRNQLREQAWDHGSSITGMRARSPTNVARAVSVFRVSPSPRSRTGRKKRLLMRSG